MTATATEPGASARAALTGRETRQFTVSPVEVRKDSEGAAIGLMGYASVTDSPYTMRDFLGEYEEVIRSGAFTKTLAEKDDVRLLLNHEGLPLARTKSGTLKLSEVMAGKDDPQERGQTGLWVEADLDPRSSLATDVKLAMERGDLDEMSFAFQVIRQEWSPDYTQRDITEVKLFDVSVVTYPANPATSVGLRASDVDSLGDDEARELMGRLQARFATQTSGRSLAAARAKAAGLRLPA
jgi:HK97 family phage prohead protease